MKWILTFGFMLCVVLACVIVYKICAFCFRKLTKTSDEEIQIAQS